MSQNSHHQNSHQDSHQDSDRTGTGARDPEQIESDLRRNRSRMDDMLDRLQAKFSPNEVFDQALRYARARTNDGSSSNLKEMVVRNPLPVALIGVGMAWLLMAGRNGSVPHEDKTRRGSDRGPSLTHGDSRNNGNTPANADERPHNRGPVTGLTAADRSTGTADRPGVSERRPSTPAPAQAGGASKHAGVSADDRATRSGTGDGGRPSGQSIGTDSGRGSQPGAELGRKPVVDPERQAGLAAHEPGRHSSSTVSNSTTPTATKSDRHGEQ